MINERNVIYFVYLNQPVTSEEIGEKFGISPLIAEFILTRSPHVDTFANYWVFNGQAPEVTT
jgi:hypothetical protein